VMGIGGRKLHTDAHASAHVAGDSSLKNKVRVKLEDRCESALLGVMAYMQVLDFPQDGFHLRVCVLFGLKGPHPHVVCMVVDDEQALTEAMWGWDFNWTPKVRGHVQE
jgi:hypothetical protein